MAVYGSKWSEDETILAFYYFCTIPSGRWSSTSPEIIHVANLLGRTTGSVVLKLCNLRSYDPESKERNVSGMQNASKLDKEIVTRFLNDWEGLAARASKIEAKLQTAHDDTYIPAGTTVPQEVQARVNQDFFRQSVLASYHSRCCITGLAEPNLLIASHIKPWAVSDPRTERANPSNGLCLNALHDKAFDRGLITVLPDYSIRVSSKLENEGTEWLRQCDYQKIILPDRFAPKKEFLEYHNDVVFVA